MNVKELRVGNLVNYGDGTLFLDINNFRDSDFNKFEPIKLTEEWLIRFGFENKDIFCFELNKHQIRLSVGNPYPYWIDSNYICSISYVHQLQNLYFALTGEELTIKK